MRRLSFHRVYLTEVVYMSPFQIGWPIYLLCLYNEAYFHPIGRLIMYSSTITLQAKVSCTTRTDLSITIKSL